MPIYEYQCEACGESLEKLQKMNDAPLTKCPKCEKDSLKKKISAAGFRLKGTGWYETDFKKSNKKNIAGSGSSKTKKTSSKSTT
jgi:putative FmdB family regulatory protein